MPDRLFDDDEAATWRLLALRARALADQVKATGDVENGEGLLRSAAEMEAVAEKKAVECGQ